MNEKKQYFDYYVISHSYQESLIDRVQKMIYDGWELQGGVSIAREGLNIEYSQAMKMVIPSDSEKLKDALAGRAAQHEAFRREMENLKLAKDKDPDKYHALLWAFEQRVLKGEF